MKKYIIPTIITLSILLGVYIVLYFAFHQDVSTIKNFEKKNYYLLENEFMVKFPKSTKVDKVEYYNGKDPVLCVYITLNESDVIQFNQSIGFETEPYNIEDDVNNCNRKDIEKALESKDTKSLIKIEYYRSEKSKQRIYIEKHRYISNEVYHIMERAGFRPINFR